MRRYGLIFSTAVAVGVLAMSACSQAGDHEGRDTGASSAAPDAQVDPSMERVALPSQSLTLAPGWQPPLPTRSGEAKPVVRVPHPKEYGVPTRTLSARASDAEITQLGRFTQALRPVPGASSADETQALAAALSGPASASASLGSPDKQQDERGIDGVLGFLRAYPKSRWAPALYLNLGALSYRTGYFQDALAHWRAAWDLAKEGSDIVSQDIANLALAESAKMNARIGRLSEVQALMKEAEGRNLMGAARGKITSASEGVWAMQNRPGVSFRCGPYALLNVADVQDPEVAKKTVRFLETVQSPPTGFSLTEVARMSDGLGLKLQMAKREPGAPLIVPAVVHWKVGHFGALVRESAERYQLKDPTFGSDVWMSARAIEQEASGFFLVPSGPLPRGWASASSDEAAQVFGKGYTSNIDDDDTGDDDHTGGGPSCPKPPLPSPALPMAVYRFHLLAASLHIEDTPVSYAPAVGPDVSVRLAYNQREADQPASIDFTSFGPQFVSNWVSYLVDNPSVPGADITLRKRGGGGEVHAGFNVTTQAYAAQRKSAAVLYRLTANTYKKVYPDTTTEFYEQYIGTTGPQRRVFLSRIVDPQGNQVSIQYNTTYPTRIERLIDATGLQTQFSFAYPGEPYLVTSIVDPLGRTSTFTYTPAAGKVRLQSSSDPFGIVSSFVYNGAGEIVSMTTPYGTTTFKLSAPYISTGLFRFVEATDALGQTERVEYNINQAQTGAGPGLEAPLPSSAQVNYVNDYNQYRNTYYWDKLQMKLAPGNYAMAHRYHWLHAAIADTTTSILESELPPLESRIFYNYPGQSAGPLFPGTLAFPSVVARVVKDANNADVTQAVRTEYNAQGNVTKRIDAAGRETLTEYAANGVDVTAIKQRTGTSGGQPVWTTVSTLAYVGSPPHRPSSVTDGAGKTTNFTYTASGQVQTIQNPKLEVTTFTYETNTASAAFGKLLTITGAVPGGNRTFTYDTSARVRTVTDSEGYTLTYDYDNLDRVRTITYPDASFEQFEFVDHSLVASRDRAGRWTRHMYNPLMQRVLTQDPELRQTQFQWCRCGELQRFVDGNGNLTEWERDERGRMTKKTQANGSFETYTYDLSGRLSTQVDAMGRTMTFRYTVDDRLAKKDYSEAATPDVTYTYDPWFPRVTTRVDGTGTTTYAYHTYATNTQGAGEVSLINGPLANDTLRHTYDELGRLKQLEIISDATPPVATYSDAYTFDDRARVTAANSSLGVSAYTFVGQSNRPLQATYPNNMKVQYDYFPATGDFMLKQIKNLNSAATPAIISQFDYTYRPDRSIETMAVRQNGVTTTWTYGYDGANQLTAATLRNASQVILESNSYAYDKAGNRTQMGNTTTAPSNAEVNNLNQLLSLRDFGPTTFAGTVDEPATVTVNGAPARMMSTDGGAPYRFEAQVSLDAGTNLVSVQAKDGRNNTSTKNYSVSSSGAAKAFEYDGNGNLRFERQPSGTVIREYQWDQQNRLVKLIAGASESQFEYDGESRRTRIRELTNGTQTKDERFVWCGSRICQKRTGTTTVARRYFDNGFLQSTTKYFYTRDHLGSVREVVASNGTTVNARLVYDAWGKLTETGTVQSDFTYTGHYLHRPSALNLAQYRGYDAGLGRWLSADPIGLRGGYNLYVYVKDDPLNLLDPDGYSPRVPGGGYSDSSPVPSGGSVCTYQPRPDLGRDPICVLYDRARQACFDGGADVARTCFKLQSSLLDDLACYQAANKYIDRCLRQKVPAVCR